MDAFRSELKIIRHFNTDYYNELLDTINRYVSEKPDITIETCKAIIEGLCKLILTELEQQPESYFKNKDLRLAKLFKDARESLKKHIDDHIEDIVYEDAIVDLYGNIPNVLEQLLNPEVIARIGAIRSEHGDISHGRSPLKLQVNDQDLAELIVGLTDNIATYMLRKFVQVKEDIIHYDDNQDFNDYLDELFPLDGKLVYSEALYDKYYEDYQAQLQEFLDAQEIDL